MDQEVKVSGEVETKAELVKASPKPEPLAEMIIRTAKPVDMSRFRFTKDDLERIRFFVESAVREQFESYVDGPRAFFEFDAKEFSERLDGFAIGEEGFADNAIKAGQAKKLARKLAAEWVNFYKYSEFRATWRERYLEFKQSLR